MELIILFGALSLFLILGVEVAFALLAACLLTFLYLDLPSLVAIQRIVAGINIFALMAIPFFIFAGDLMNRSGIAERIIRVAESALGRSQGGLARVNIGASMLFGSVSGSAVASVSAMGSTIMPMMKQKGYHTDYVVNVTCTAAILGLIIPPSHNMIIYAASSGIGISVGDLFLAGIVPGILAGAMLMFTAWVIAVKRGYPKGTFLGWRAFLKAFIIALPGLFTALIIIVGILAGVFTPTESSAVAIAYTIIIGVFVYKSLGVKNFLLAAKGAVRTTAMVMIIIGAAAVFGWLLALLQAPTQLAEFITTITDNPILILLAVNIVLLILGTFMDMAPLIIIATPIFLPVAQQIGIDPVHFGIIMMLNLGIGLTTPPVGSVLFVGASIGGIRIEDTIKTIWPFYLTLIAALMLVTFIPALSLALPNWLN